MSIQGVQMIKASDFTSLSMAEPDFLGVLYRTALVRRDMLIFRRDEWLARFKILSKINTLATINKKFAGLTTGLKFDLPKDSARLEECLKLLSALIDNHAELSSMLEKEGLASEALFRHSLKVFERANEELKAARDKWAEMLADLFPTPRYDLDDLLQQITPENRHEIVSWGNPVGKEVW
jgi:hypothetical protein